VTTDLTALLGDDGVCRWQDLAARTHPSSVTRWLASGRLVRPLPGVVALPVVAGCWRSRAGAAVLWSGGHLAGRSALAAWDVVATPGPLVRVAVRRSRNVPTVPDWLRVHRIDLPHGPTRDGFPVLSLARSLVDCWGHAHARTGSPRDVEIARGALIGAVRRRVTAVREVRRELRGHPKLPGRAALVHLLDLVEAGCQSEFEIWGLRHLLDVPGLPPVTLQHPLVTRIGEIHHDGAWPKVRLAVELDGAQFHRAPDRREQDLRRDAASLARGWAVLRISYRRAHAEPEVCREEIATAFHARR